MRYVFAIAALVLSGILLLLGIGQRTFLAGPSEISYSVASVDGSSYAMIPSEVFDEVAGQPNVVVSGTNAFAAVGSVTDIEAWLAPFDYQLIATHSGDQALHVTSVAAELPPTETADAAEGDAADPTAEEDTSVELLDPRGSDLWLEERSTNPDAESTDDAAATGDQTLRLPVQLAADQAVLVAADGVDPVADTLSIAWAQDRNTPLAGPLLAAGGVFALLGGVLYLLAIDHDRRGLGPRRGRKGPLQGIRNIFAGKKHRASQPTEMRAATPGRSGAPRRFGRAAVPALGLALALGVSGCSASYWPEFGAEEVVPVEETVPPSAIAPVPVTGPQLERILERVSAVAADADETLDAELLKQRFSDDALAQRSANYTIRASVPDYEVVPPVITAEGLDYELVQSTEGWPRTIFATVASQTPEQAAAEQAAKDGTDPTATAEAAPEDAAAEEQPASPSLALVMTQQSPHENYLVSRVISLRGGIAMPAAAPAEEGTALLADDLQTLALMPKDVGKDYAALLAQGTSVDEAKLFDLESDTLIEKSGLAWVTQAQAAADAEEQSVVYSVAAAQSETPIVSLSTGVGGALVTTTVIEERTESAGEGNWKPTAVGSVTALSGLEGRQESLVRQVAHQLLFFVPSKDSGEKIQILGVTSELVGARN